MEYSEAVVVVNANYGPQATKITSSLSEETIITLASLCKSNNKRNMTDFTIDRLSVMEPYRQCGFVANPLLQWLLDSATFSACAPSQTVPEPQQNNVPSNDKKPESNKKPEKKPEPEPEPEDPNETLFDLFG